MINVNADGTLDVSCFSMLPMYLAKEYCMSSFGGWQTSICLCELLVDHEVTIYVIHHCYPFSRTKSCTVSSASFASFIG